MTEEQRRMVMRIHMRVKVLEERAKVKDDTIARLIRNNNSIIKQVQKMSQWQRARTERTSEHPADRDPGG